MSPPPSKLYDLFVIGGGINGAAIACDAAGRGLAVALAEERDFAEGTSSRSSKLIHGGLRYLETYDFRLVRHALLEREILMAKAPHLVWPIRLVLPHVPSLRPRWLIRLGLIFYDFLARRRRLPRSQAIDLRRHPFGQALKTSLTHAFAYSDCRGDDARLVIANVQGAAAHGADILARHRFVGAQRHPDRWRIELENKLTGRRSEIGAKLLVNAAGPWVIAVGGTVEGVATARRLRMVRGGHIVVPRQWEGEHGYFIQTRDNRTMELFPYEGDFTSIGTTDEPWEEAPEKVTVSDKEIDYMLEEANQYLRKPVSRADIVWRYAGVRPLFEVGSGRDGDLSTLTRDYAFEIDGGEGRAPALTVFGGKLTTHRRLAEHAMAELARFFPSMRDGRSRTESLPGGDFGPGGMEGHTAALQHDVAWLPEKQLRRYVKLYGTKARALLGPARSLADLGRLFGADLYQCEVDYLMDREWALAAEDIVWRRTKLGLRMTPAEIEALGIYMASRPPAWSQGGYS
ncbi:MAG TPA: glycerol-3-phosphate dehydrogenase [Hypericibacter adhaerens]|jgi:glycerol-3-phosphate dehydrogenase|uniref:Glycerol-3-phosphate dehydrogenase n=1 Tax=Hypericibacter adhaerens TaxID=2602016 RepID=A0A5J6MZG8_9PROT|nr:glycerol-3-phosphate dehydrogenase [Hypericibacter adhaerens]QEX22949.1 glycerol-3-phosphate dehydrogenase [Hypericibacter adhaerens]HWA43558.1 glycerol-3-phosphate dehydrogenase [Hypericibacter adhaerens]